MIPELIIVALLLGWALGGKFGRLADAPIKWIWLLAVPVVLYVAALCISRTPAIAMKLSWFYGASHLAGKAVLLVFIYANRHIPGAKIVLVGMILNFIAISANGGMMPAKPSAVIAAWDHDFLVKMRNEVHTQSSIGGDNYNVKILCDFIPAVRPYFLIPGVYSIGDMFISLGIVIGIIALMRAPMPQKKIIPQEA